MLLSATAISSAVKVFPLSAGTCCTPPPPYSGPPKTHRLHCQGFHHPTDGPLHT